MNYQSLLKQLKKRLRSKKGWLSLGSVVLAVGTLAGGAWRLEKLASMQDSRVEQAAVQASANAPLSKAPSLSAEQEETLQLIQDGTKERNVFVQKRYVCGEETERLGGMKPEDIVLLQEDHPEWQIALESEEVYFTEQIEDLSPKCKQTAYFGIDKNGNLSLFDGQPASDQVIRTFFQLNVEHLRSSLPPDAVNQLYEGIRISDLADYNSVLSTYSDYAVEAEHERGTKPKA